ncbi:MAG TPA: glycoside hydrolase family 97 catalytic domain-containing protein, partial [Puia sp.]|nr:glycoside hydrolase family 97 catalytic domain-containing protein [Puia sp.]
ATYKYYIDFAADNHLRYILLDEGWSDDADLMKVVPDIDLPAIIGYARERNVGVWLWSGALAMGRQMDEVMHHYSEMGIKGFKVDFMNRDDQQMVRFYYRAAKTAAACHLMLDFHGAYKPTGLQRTYPNVLNFEGVRGMENEKWSNDDFPSYDVSIPFIRMLAGPLDYTPGAMKNYNKANFRPIFSEPMSQGTRCHQLAMYIVYEAPFSMLSDNPTSYRREPESVQFIAGVPSFFDETRSLDGEVGQYVMLARRKAGDWWVGAMTNWTPRDLNVDLSFLPSGNYRAEIMRDGINADRDGTDYRKETVEVTRESKLAIHLAPGGGWVAKIHPEGEGAAAGSATDGAAAGTGMKGGAAVPPPAIDVNQVGFYPRAPKMAIVAGGPDAAENFYLVSMNGGDTVFRGLLGPATPSANSSLSTRLADFSAFRSPGLYSVVVPGLGRSHSFRIADKVLFPVARAALKGFYYIRSGTALTPAYAGKWSRVAGHPDTEVLVHPSAATASRPAGTVIRTPGGWYDAGDYNKYVVNSGITMGTLLDAYEDFPGFFDTLHTNIPPVPGVPDLLNEVLYNLRWMLTMQDPGDGGVYHKCTNAAFDGMVMPDITRAPRYVVQKGTAATLDFAAVMAQAARMLRSFRRSLPSLSDSCLRAAEYAWQWALQHPAVIYDQDQLDRTFTPAITTGAYGDRHFNDEWFWAASELLVTTGNDQYGQVVREHAGDTMILPSWSNVQMMGDYTLLRYRKSLPASWEPLIRSVQGRVLRMADSWLAQTGANAFHSVMGESRRDFVWGSNSVAANQGMLLVAAWLQTGDGRYLAPAVANMDYLLGMNATGYCFI